MKMNKMTTTIGSLATLGMLLIAFSIGGLAGCAPAGGGDAVSGAVASDADAATGAALTAVPSLLEANALLALGDILGDYFEGDLDDLSGLKLKQFNTDSCSAAGCDCELGGRISFGSSTTSFDHCEDVSLSANGSMSYSGTDPMTVTFDTLSMTWRDGITTSIDGSFSISGSIWTSGIITYDNLTVDDGTNSFGAHGTVTFSESGNTSSGDLTITVGDYAAHLVFDMTSGDEEGTTNGTLTATAGSESVDRTFDNIVLTSCSEMSTACGVKTGFCE